MCLLPIVHLVPNGVTDNGWTVAYIPTQVEEVLTGLHLNTLEVVSWPTVRV